jgi:hypothetical protein
MPSETSEPTAYVAHFGFDRRTCMTLIGCVAFVALLIWMPTAASAFAWVIKVAGLLLFGLGGLVFAFMAARGGVALSVDAHGITLGNPRIPQPGTTNRPVGVPWRDVAEVVLFDQYHAGGRMPYIGLRFRPEAQAHATTFNPDSRLWPTNRSLMRHVPEDVLLRSRPANGWRLDERLLCEAVARHAPAVPVVRLDEAGQPHPVIRTSPPGDQDSRSYSSR